MRLRGLGKRGKCARGAEILETDSDAGGRRQAIFELGARTWLDWLREEPTNIEIGARSRQTLAGAPSRGAVRFKVPNAEREILDGVLQR